MRSYANRKGYPDFLMLNYTFAMSRVPQSEVGNRILSSLHVDDFRHLEQGLERVELPVRYALETAGRRIKSICFLEEGLASVVAVSRPSGRQAEVGLVGSEGVTGFSLIHGIDHAPYNVFMQAPGWGYVVPADVLRNLLEANRRLQAFLLRFSYVFHVQAGGAVLANATASIEERLCRWLLMTHDRIPGDELHITHEFFSVMLGIRRPGITIGLRRLETEGLIALRRGVTVIIDREGLIVRANGMYGKPEAEYERVFPSG